jgi:chaperonin GroES
VVKSPIVVKGDSMKSGFQPLYDRVLLQRKSQEKLAGRIHIPDSVDNKPIFGTVVAVGDGAIMNDGSVRKIAVKVGQMVMFEAYAGFELELDIAGSDGKKAEFVVVKEEEILGVMNNG